MYFRYGLRVCCVRCFVFALFNGCSICAVSCLRRSIGSRSALLLVCAVQWVLDLRCFVFAPFNGFSICVASGLRRSMGSRCARLAQVFVCLRSKTKKILFCVKRFVRDGCRERNRARCSNAGAVIMLNV